MIMAGYAYDYTTTALQNYNSGTHEIMLRFELVSRKKDLNHQDSSNTNSL